MLQSGKPRPAVFLDRDGVINRALIVQGLPYSPRKIEELVVIDGVKDAVSRLSEKGFEIVVVTNQPDVANGLISQGQVENFHKIISLRTGIKHFYVCYHNEGGGCDCRKPKIGLLTKAADELNIDLSRSFLVGDRWKDIKAGQSVGCLCLFIDNDYAERRPEPPFYTVVSLLQAVDTILEKDND
jgi:D-glycero-D-manno-heptose 1,7-bisphosphate phosphatase